MLKRRCLVEKLLILLIAGGGVLGESRALDLPELSESFSTDFKAPGLSKSQGIAFHPVRKSLFVALRSPGRLLELDWSGSLLAEYSVSPMTDIPEGVAYDWVTGSLLFVKGNTDVFYLDPDEPAEEPGLLFVLAGAPVELTLRVRGPGGDIRLEKSLVVAAREKMAGLLDEPIFFGPTFSQIGGSLEATGAAETLATSVFVAPHYLSYIEGQAPLDSRE